jgi:molecular chaperone GrpE
VKERDRYLRLAAEFDNYRKRTERDMTEFRRRAADHVLLSVLDVVDNLDRALETSDTCDVSDLVTGLEAIRNQIGTLLEREAISPIDTVGEEFDPFLMEAVMRMPSDDVEEGRVVSELQKGYQTPEHVLRPSKIVVSSGPKVDDEG